MEVEFGDEALFTQLYGDEQRDETAQNTLQLQHTLGVLREENEELKRKLRFLSRPAGINAEDSGADAPLFHIFFGNNGVSKQHRQEIEDCVLGLVQKFQKEHSDGSTARVPPQNSSFVMEEDWKCSGSSPHAPTRDAFRMVGSVLYFTDFCLDRLGQPLLNENPQLTEGWDIPKYSQIFSQVLGLGGQELQVKEKRPKPSCFNCGAEDHQLRDCPKPKDMARINEKRKEFSSAAGQNNFQGSQRYHAEEVEERFAKYKPGIVSKELMEALGVVGNTLPPFIYRMRELGYPPGWLKEAELEHSGLALYDGKEEEDVKMHSQTVSYDVSKLVDFPGFNISAPSNVRDDYMCFGSIPMQPHHWKEAFAAHLSQMYPTSGSPGLKRSSESELTPQRSKRHRANSDVRSSDMEMDSDQDSLRKCDGFQFQPPLPPGSPLISTPPPLPLGTPPVTPTPPPLPKGTPPPTPPAYGSPVLPGRAVAVGEESEDGLSLEELEEQQRLLWAELQNAENTTSDSETGGAETPHPESSGGSTCRMEVEMEMEEGEEEPEEGGEGHFRETLSTPASPEDDRNGSGNTPETQESHVGGEAYDDFIVLDEATQENGGEAADAGGEAADVGPGEAADAGGEAADVGLGEAAEAGAEAADVGPGEATDAGDEAADVGPGKVVIESNSRAGGDEEGAPASTVSCVPHRSQFAKGITPFEETPEFTEVSEATGVYLRIRDLLKGSPRNVARSKK